MSKAINITGGIMFGNQFILGHQSQEIVLTPAQTPLFSNNDIRMAGLTYVRDQYLCARKQPKHHVLIFSIEGQGELTTRQQTFTLGKGQIAVLNQGQDFVYQATQSHWSFVWFIVEPSPRWLYLESRLQPILDHRQFEQLPHMLNLLALSLPADTRQQLCIDIINIINQCLSSHKSQKNNHKLAQLFQAVEQHLHYPWTAKTLAERLHVSEPTLHRMCLKHYQQSPKQLVINLRINKAKLLLQNTDWSLAIIASQVGYKDGFALSKSVKKHLGISPIAVREL